MLSEINRALKVLGELKTELENTPKDEALRALIKACEDLDVYYKEFCNELDHEYDVPEGTTYEEGFNMEFYIEAYQWHEISLALRTLRA
jgi:hypothetical protein